MTTAEWYFFVKYCSSWIFDGLKSIGQQKIDVVKALFAIMRKESKRRLFTVTMSMLELYQRQQLLRNPSSACPVSGASRISWIRGPNGFFAFARSQAERRGHRVGSGSAVDHERLRPTWKTPQTNLSPWLRT